MRPKIKKADDLLTQFARSKGIRPPQRKRRKGVPESAIKYIAEKLLLSLEDAVALIELVASAEEFAERSNEIARFNLYISDARDYLRRCGGAS